MKQVAIIGGGPAGLMAAELIANAGHKVIVFDRMPSVGRKFLMAGRGGLNITHSEDWSQFITRYSPQDAILLSSLKTFTADDLRAWCHGLGQSTFIGSSGRIFPESMKASPLLRAWLNRLMHLGVSFQLQRNWMGWDSQGRLLFETSDHKTESYAPDAVCLALGGGSWPKLGSNASWVDILASYHIPITPLCPSNVGLMVSWSCHFKDHFQGSAFKNIKLSFGQQSIRGELVITDYGLEGGALYALSSPLRTALQQEKKVTAYLDLRPDQSAADLAEKLARPRNKQSTSTFLRKTLGLSASAINLLREAYNAPLPSSSSELAALIKAVPITFTDMQPLERAISTAGGIAFSALTNHFMLQKLPGVFVAGEMIDWEAPTGGYLLQATFATAVSAANGLLQWLENHV